MPWTPGGAYSFSLNPKIRGLVNSSPTGMFQGPLANLCNGRDEAGTTASLTLTTPLVGF